MRRIIIFLFLYISLNLYSQSVAELTLINDKTGESINYYDSPSYFLKMVGADTCLLEDIRPNRFKEISGDGYILKTRLLYSDYPVRGELLKYYTIDTLRIFKNFRTFRGVSIGSNKYEVINLYPESKLYKQGGFYWENINWDYEKGKSLPSGLSFMTMFWDYGIRKRIPEIDMDIIYGFSFYFDEKDKVKEIKIGFFLTEP